jgi:hypothetical protein
VAKYFDSEEGAEAFIKEHRRTGSIQSAELSVEEKHVLGIIRLADDYSPELLLDAWRDYRSRQKTSSSFTVTELCEAFYTRQVAEKRSARTLNDDRWRLNKLALALGGTQANDCSPADIRGYLESIPPGTNRRSHFKTLRKLWRWAYQLGHIEDDPMARMRPTDSWGVNVERLSPALYSRILRVISAKESPAQGQEVTTKYQFLFPFFVLAGLAGLRTTELIRYKPGEPVLEWSHILWKKKLIYVPHEVAKETRARDRRRYPPLEPAAAELLEPVAGKGAIMPCSPSHFNRSRQKLAAAMWIRLPENCLRNSYATYAQTFRSTGDVAKAMGDKEETVKRYYIETLEPNAGKTWFKPKVKSKRLP